MRIITVNLPIQYIEIIKTMTGEDNLYPSRSELIRVAIKEFIVQEISNAKNFVKFQKEFGFPPIKKGEEITIIGDKKYKNEFDSDLNRNKLIYVGDV